jgi:hypothetical protein
MKRPIKLHTLSQEQTQRVAEDIYIYGYPLLLLDVIKRIHTARAHPGLQGAPLNQFAHRPLLPERDKNVVHPLPDCLRSSAWLDVSKEPVILSIPPSPKYYLLTLFTNWFEIFQTCSPRNSGVHGGHLGFVSPRWHGKLPAAVKRIVAPSDTIWVDGCIEADGPDGGELVRALQEQFRLTPLSEWGNDPRSRSLPHRLDVDETHTPQEQLAKLEAREFFTRLSVLMRRHPTVIGDADIVAQFARVGFFPAEDFAFDMLPASTIAAMHRAVNAAQARMEYLANALAQGRTINGWILHVHPGYYGTNYVRRAVDARIGTPVALAEDVLCFHTTVDQAGEPLTGDARYVINFLPEHLPPVNAFWSIAVYNSRQCLVTNDLHRNVIGDRNRLRRNADKDNSLSIHIQHDWPGAANDSNWLPSPKHIFRLTLRMYWPKAEAFDGNWRPPAVIRLD